MWKKGVATKNHANSKMQAFSVDKVVSFENADQIYITMQPDWMKLIQEQHFTVHSTSNYNAYHSLSAQAVPDKDGVMNLGMVYNATHTMEYQKPTGIIYHTINKMY